MKKMRQVTGGRMQGLGLFFGFLSAGLLFTAVDGQAALGENSDDPFSFDIAIGTEVMAGDTTYSIGGNIINADGSFDSVHFPVSELEWPLDIWLARVDAGVTFASSWRINGTLKMDISDPDDHMLDSDWLTLSNPGKLDVFSETNISDFDALIWDIDVEWSFYQTDLWSLYTGVGYMYQNFEYEGQLIRQYSPSGLLGYDYAGNGEVGITYEMTYDMFYLLIGGEFQVTPQFSLSGSFAFSPFTSGEDEDHHLLREKVSYGDMDGTAVMFDLAATYYFLPSLYVEAGYEFVSISVDGTQDQLAYGIPMGQIDIESESTQNSGYLTVGYQF
jgi:outer membrane protease